MMRTISSLTKTEKGVAVFKAEFFFPSALRSATRLSSPKSELVAGPRRELGRTLGTTPALPPTESAEPRFLWRQEDLLYSGKLLRGPA